MRQPVSCGAKGSSRISHLMLPVRSTILRETIAAPALIMYLVVMSCVPGRSGGVDAEACGDAISQCLSVGPSASDVVHGVVRAC